MNNLLRVDSKSSDVYKLSILSLLPPNEDFSRNILQKTEVNISNLKRDARVKMKREAMLARILRNRQDPPSRQRSEDTITTRGISHAQSDRYTSNIIVNDPVKDKIKIDNCYEINEEIDEILVASSLDKGIGYNQFTGQLSSSNSERKTDDSDVTMSHTNEHMNQKESLPDEVDSRVSPNSDSSIYKNQLDADKSNGFTAPRSIASFHESNQDGSKDIESHVRTPSYSDNSSISIETEPNNIHPPLTVLTRLASSTNNSHGSLQSQPFITRVRKPIRVQRDEDYFSSSDEERAGDQQQLTANKRISYHRSIIAEDDNSLSSCASVSLLTDDSTINFTSNVAVDTEDNTGVATKSVLPDEIFDENMITDLYYMQQFFNPILPSIVNDDMDSPFTYAIDNTDIKFEYFWEFKFNEISQ